MAEKPLKPTAKKPLSAGRKTKADDAVSVPEHENILSDGAPAKEKDVSDCLLRGGVDFFLGALFFLEIPEVAAVVAAVLLVAPSLTALASTSLTSPDCILLKAVILEANLVEVDA